MIILIKVLSISANLSFKINLIYANLKLNLSSPVTIGAIKKMLNTLKKGFKPSNIFFFKLPIFNSYFLSGLLRGGKLG